MRTKFIVFSSLLTLASLVAFSNCSRVQTETLQGTTAGNPMVEFSFGSFESTGFSLTGCFTELRLKSQGSSLFDVSIPLDSNLLTLNSAGTALYQAQVPNGIYSQVQIDLRPECGVSESLRITNSSGTYSTAEKVQITFTGENSLQGNYFQVGLNVAVIIESLDQVSADTQLKLQAEAVAGDWVALSPGWNTLGLSGAPEGRDFHSAVWTGQEMIVFGGMTVPRYASRNDGGRYNPSTDTWTALPLLNAPTARIRHGSAWTGTQMFIWGGDDSFTNFFDSGALFTPSNGTWTATNQVGAPAPRRYFVTLWTGSEVIVFGGKDTAPVSGGARYNPSTDTWTTMSTVSQPTTCVEVPAVWTGQEMIIWGCGAGNDVGARYNPTTDTWLPVNSTGAPTARSKFTAVWNGSEMIVWGGERAGVFQTGAKYNPSTDTWTSLSQINAPTARSYHAAVWTGSRMIVWGGYSGSLSDPKIYYRDGGTYDPLTDQWSPIQSSNSPQGRIYMSPVWTGIEMLIWGGGQFNSSHSSDHGRFLP
jgi:N-acetylneuraminic acid mutarotase